MIQLQLPYRLITFSFPFSEARSACSPTEIINFLDKVLQSITYFRTIAYGARDGNSLAQKLRSAKVCKAGNRNLVM